jgi:hypothetical protein
MHGAPDLLYHLMNARMSNGVCESQVGTLQGIKMGGCRPGLETVVGKSITRKNTQNEEKIQP